MSPIKEKGSISTTLNLWWTGIDLNYRAFLLLISIQQPITTMIGMIIVKFHTPTKINNNNLITKTIIPILKIKYSIGCPYNK